MTQLWRHQQAAVDFALPRNASLIASDPGTGKSLIAVTLLENWSANRTIIVCPASVRGVWRREFMRHANTNPLVAVLDQGTVQQRCLQAHNACKHNGPVVVVVNYEATYRLPIMQWINEQSWDVAVYDESHRIQGTSLTATVANRLSKQSGHRLCLSGTPLTQDPISVWAQCRFLDRTVFGENLDWFKRRYHSEDALRIRKRAQRARERTIKQAPMFARHLPPLACKDWGVSRPQEFTERLNRVAYRISNAVLDLPPLLIERRDFQLGEEARRIYGRISRDHTEDIRTPSWRCIDKSYPVTMALQEVTSGWLPQTDRTVQIDHGKEDLLRDILTDTKEPVAVFTRFVRDLDVVYRVATELGRTYTEVSQRRHDGLDPLGQMVPCDVIGVQEQAGGVGVDLTRARIGVSYSLSWSRALRQQKIARLHRPGARPGIPVVMYELVARESVDEEMYLALAARDSMVEQAWQATESSQCIASLVCDT